MTQTNKHTHAGWFIKDVMEVSVDCSATVQNSTKKRKKLNRNFLTLTRTIVLMMTSPSSHMRSLRLHIDWRWWLMPLEIDGRGCWEDPENWTSKPHRWTTDPRSQGNFWTPRTSKSCDSTHFIVLSLLLYIHESLSVVFNNIVSNTSINIIQNWITIESWASKPDLAITAGTSKHGWWSPITAAKENSMP